MGKEGREFGPPTFQMLPPPMSPSPIPSAHFIHFLFPDIGPAYQYNLTRKSFVFINLYLRM